MNLENIKAYKTLLARLIQSIESIEEIKQSVSQAELVTFSDQVGRRDSFRVKIPHDDNMDSKYLEKLRIIGIQFQQQTLEIVNENLDYLITKLEYYSKGYDNKTDYLELLKDQ